MTISPIHTMTSTQPIACKAGKGKASLLCLLAIGGSMLLLPMQGCESTSTRSGSNLNEIDPALSHIRRRKQESLEHYNIASKLHLEDKTEEALVE